MDSGALQASSCEIIELQSQDRVFNGPIGGGFRYSIQRSGFTVDLANSSRQHAKVDDLLTRMYSRRGYLTRDFGSAVRGVSAVTFQASIGQHIVGTLTVGSGVGILANDLYKHEIASFLGKDRKASEISKFAVDPKYGSKELLASLFQAAYVYLSSDSNATHTFIEVNPRHVGFYRRMLGFQQLGELRVCPRVNAPAVLLGIEIAYVGRQIAKYAGSAPASGDKSLYPYFLGSAVMERTAKIEDSQAYKDAAAA